MDDLAQIKRLVIAHRVLFTEKAEGEMAADGLTPELVYEAILNAPAMFEVDAVSLCSFSRLGQSTLVRRAQTECGALLRRQRNELHRIDI